MTTTTPPLFPVQTQPEDLTRAMARDHADLGPEQDKREPFMNSIEHGGTIFVTDVEKVAAMTLTDAAGNPVLRRLYADNASGMPADDMPSLLRNYGHSSKPAQVFSGNHGMGVILANGMKNPAGTVFISKTAGSVEPYLCYWEVINGIGQLRPFWIPDLDANGEEIEDQGEFFPIIAVAAGDSIDGIDWYEVWCAAYDNPRFNGVPESGTVVVEIGESLTDSTYPRSQSTFDAKRDEWIYSRWGVGQYYNSHFWEIPILTCWGVPQNTFGYDFKNDCLKRGVKALDFKGSKWVYREAKGLKDMIHQVTAAPAKDQEEDDDLPLLASTVVEDAGDYPHGTCPFSVEVYIRTLPAGVEARKQDFPVRRQGMIFVDYNGEVFPHPNPSTAHALFGMTDARLRENVWLRIIPKQLGDAKAGSVWMPSGRKTLAVHTVQGSSTDLPWYEWAGRFKADMPHKLLDAIKAMDDKDTNVNELNDPKFRKWWEKVAPDFVLRKIKEQYEVQKPTPARSKSAVKGEGDGRRGPIVNPGETHSRGNDENKRRPPRRKPGTTPGTEPAIAEREVDKKFPKYQQPDPPIIKWIHDPESWGMGDDRFAVKWDEPGAANEHRGMVRINWNHWYIQQRYRELTEVGAPFNHAPNQVEDRMKTVYGMSVATKIGHRRAETRNVTLGFTPEEIEKIFSKEALTGFVLGIWDHEGHLMRALARAGRITAAGDPIEDDVEAEGVA